MAIVATLSLYIEKGTVKLSVTTASGKEAFLALLGGGDFFGESCLASRYRTRFHTATAVTDMRVMKIDRLSMIRVLRVNSEFAYPSSHISSHATNVSSRTWLTVC
jgi:CRP/FNR family transcriptional regulator, cyclic AMP receptor protein